MWNVAFPSIQTNDTANYDPAPGYATDHETISRIKQDPWMEMDDSGFMELFSSVFDQENNLQSKPELIGFAQDDVNCCKNQKENQNLSCSLAPLNNYGTSKKSKTSERRLSMEETLMIAGERFIQFSTNRSDGISMFIHPYSSSLSDLSNEDSRDVELLHFLLAASEYSSNKQYDLARKLIARCLWIASDSGSPAQRVSFYFAGALQDKVDRESGLAVPKNKLRKEAEGLALVTNNAFLAAHQELPFAQVMQFAGIQAIIEKVKTGGKIHLIDLQIRSGIHWTALMQGIEECSIKCLRITAIGTYDQQHIEETGKRLESFASSLNLPFSFKAVYLTDMKAFKQDLLQVERDETVAVYTSMMLRTMISQPNSLENVMRAIASIKPAVMVVLEVEANHNSPSFICRFTEALLFYSAYFDCLEECMDRETQYRRIIEETYFGQGIVDIVAAGDEERINRNVKIDVWRAFFRRFGMVEMELSESSKYQASLVLKRFPKGGSCNLEWDGKGLIVGWKGTPLQSLTAWEFS